MPLDAPQAKWINQFTFGAFPLPGEAPPQPGDTSPAALEARKQELAFRRAEDLVKEAVLKAALLDKARKVINDKKKQIREAFDVTLEIDLEKVEKSQRSRFAKQQKMMDASASKKKQFEATDADKLSQSSDNLGGAPKEFKRPEFNDGSFDTGGADLDHLSVADNRKGAKAGQRMAMGEALRIVVDEKDKLAAKKVNRYELDEAGRLIQVAKPLFSEKELIDELYTPLVREQIIPDTVIDARFSQVQKMIDGSNEYYIKECQTKGKVLASGGVALAKGAVQVGMAVATAVIAASGSTDLSAKDAAKGAIKMEHLEGLTDKLSKQQVAQATAITFGVGAILSAGLDAIDVIDDKVNKDTVDDFPTAKLKAVMNGLALGIGKTVAGAMSDPSGGTGNTNIGLAITGGIVGGTALASIGAAVANWRRKRGEPPVGEIIGALGEAIGNGFNAASAQTSGGLSTALGQTSAAVTMAFTTAARAAEKKLIDAWKSGDWAAFVAVLTTTCTEAAKAGPVIAIYAGSYNALEGLDKTKQQSDAEIHDKQFQDQQKMLTMLGVRDLNTDKGGAALEKLLTVATQKLQETRDRMPPGELEKHLRAAEEAFKSKQADMESELKDFDDIEKALSADAKSYKNSLNCLGSTNPSDAEHKQIARMLAQLERDRAIWDGVTALLGAGLAAGATVEMATQVAQQVAPGLKAAGQLVKFCVNAKMAAERLAHFLEWRDAQRDSVSAVSPYATAINNFVRNQKHLCTQYTVQAAGNFIQALLACGELTPYAPAFKLTGALVGATMAAEDALYQFVKKQELVSAWNQTKEALRPQNRGNRKLHLEMREINPTLAKYTIAYGALIEQDPIAVGALNNIGLDRECLTRAGDKVKEVKDYLDKLYYEDGSTVGVLDAEEVHTKVPASALTAKAWALSVLLWQQPQVKPGQAPPLRLMTASPPAIAANLVVAQAHAAKDMGTMAVDELEELSGALIALQVQFRDFRPLTDAGTLHRAAVVAAGTYADLAAAAARKASEALAQRKQALEEQQQQVKQLQQGSGVTTGTS